MHGSLPGLAAGRFGVIMFFSACRLPSFAPEDPPSHASGNQITTGFHVALELEHVESVDLRSAIRKADAVLPAFAREGQRGHTVKRVARRGRCRLLFLLGVQHIFSRFDPVT